MEREVICVKKKGEGRSEENIYQTIRDDDSLVSHNNSRTPPHPPLQTKKKKKKSNHNAVTEKLKTSNGHPVISKDNGVRVQ